MSLLDSIDNVLELLTRQQHVAERPLATAIFLMARLGKPLLLEGEAGVGQTEVATKASSRLRSGVATAGDLYKSPGVAESIDWARALNTMDESRLDEEVVVETIGVVLKNQEDIARLQGRERRDLLERTRRAG